MQGYEFDVVIVGGGSAGCAAAGRLCATTDPKEAVERSDVALICVGTPGRANGQLDAEAIERVGRELGLALAGREEPFTVVLRSTVLPGTTERGGGLWVGVCRSPSADRSGGTMCGARCGTPWARRVSAHSHLS